MFQYLEGVASPMITYTYDAANIDSFYCYDYQKLFHRQDL